MDALILSAPGDPVSRRDARSARSYDYALRGRLAKIARTHPDYIVMDGPRFFLTMSGNALARDILAGAFDGAE